MTEIQELQYCTYNKYDGRPILYVGPWVGEFGHEVGDYCGFVNQLKNEFPDYYLVVSSYRGRYPLYFNADFVVGYDWWPAVRSCAQCQPLYEWDGELYEALKRVFKLRGEMSHASIPSDIYSLAQSKKDIIFNPQQSYQKHIYSASSIKHYRGLDILYHNDKLLNKQPFSVDKLVVLFPRMKADGGEKRGILYEYWCELCNRLLAEDYVVVISGNKDETFDLSDNVNTSDVIFTYNQLPNNELSCTIGYLSLAKFCVGVVSAGSLLSMICRCPTFIISNSMYDTRLTSRNYLKTPMFIYNKGNNHDINIDDAQKYLNIFLDNLDSDKNPYPLSGMLDSFTGSYHVEDWHYGYSWNEGHFPRLT
jgi:hypothetical protein